MQSITEVDPSFGVVEFHPANLDLPNRLPSAQESRRSLATLLGAGAKFLSPMWGSIASGQSLFPAQFHAYEAMEGTEFETELVRFLREWSSKPVDSKRGKKGAKTPTLEAAYVRGERAQRSSNDSRTLVP
jgi:hypothetical protein